MVNVEQHSLYSALTQSEAAVVVSTLVLKDLKHDASIRS